MARAPFETQRFDDLAPVSIQQTERVKKPSGSPQALAAGFGKLVEANTARFTTKLENESKRDAESVAAVARVAAGPITGDLPAIFEKKGLDAPQVRLAVKEFQKLSLAVESGRLPSDFIKTLALTKMKKLQNENPEFANEIRKAATEILRFDPTGADITEALSILDRQFKDSKSQTDLFAEARKSAARAHPATPELSDDEFRVWAINQGNREKDKARLEGEKLVSGLNSRRVSNYLENISKDAQESVLGDVLFNTSPSGVGRTEGIFDPQNTRNAAVDRMRAQYNAFIVSTEFDDLVLDDRERLQRQFDASVATIDAMVDERSVASIGSAHRGTMKSLFLDELYDNEALGKIHAIAGGEGVVAFLSDVNKFKTPAVIEAVKSLGGKWAGLKSLTEKDRNRSLVLITNDYQNALLKSKGGIPLNADEASVMAATGKAIIANQEKPNAGVDIVNLRAGIGDGLTLKVMNDDSVAIAIAKDASKAKEFNNLFNSEMASQGAEIKAIMEEIGRSGLIKMNIVDAVSKDKARVIDRIRGTRRVERPFTTITFSVPKNTSRDDLKKDGSLELYNRAKNFEREIRTLMQLSETYGKAGVLSKEVKSSKDLVDFLTAVPEEGAPAE